MFVTRHKDAGEYHPPKHFGMVARRLQGMEASDMKDFFVGLSTLEPGGGAEEDASPFEKVYVVLSGEVTVVQDGEETVLGPLDSCGIAAGESRSIVNKTKDPASMVVIISTRER
ncbi:MULTISPECIES: cupin domain-containing protein [Kordiimonas]|jgi:quercetin dioxygenase-like cupin family protein|uniref:cupin domain-containing protein n=1 Tax=Kordiimonas TaxID=288021 RepID=UPI00257A3F6D|nr:cupin domain-containing protein [Kordiimonas sp. UBA4487]